MQQQPRFDYAGKQTEKQTPSTTSDLSAGERAALESLRRETAGRTKEEAAGQCFMGERLPGHQHSHTATVPRSSPRCREELCPVYQEHYTTNDTSSATSGSGGRATGERDGLIAQLRLELAAKDAVIATLQAEARHEQERQAQKIRFLLARVDELAGKVRALEQQPGRESAQVRARAQQADAVAQRSREVFAGQQDTRVTGTQARIRTALVRAGCTREGPTKISRAAVAKDAGVTEGTVSTQLTDMDATRQIVRERRPVWRERPCMKDGEPVFNDDGTPKTYKRREWELWVTLAEGPDPALTKKEVRALCPNLVKDRTRPRCPRCRSPRLTPTTFLCRDCKTACTAEEAEEAGKRTQQRPDGTLVDTASGQTFAPPPPPRKGRRRAGAGGQPAALHRPPHDTHDIGCESQPIGTPIDGLGIATHLGDGGSSPFGAARARSASPFGATHKDTGLREPCWEDYDDAAVV